MKFNRLFLVLLLISSNLSIFAGNTPKLRNMYEGKGNVPTFNFQKSLKKVWKTFYRFFYSSYREKTLCPLLYNEMKTGSRSNHNKISDIVTNLRSKDGRIVGPLVSQFRIARNKSTRNDILKQIANVVGYNYKLLGIS